ncbi:related to NAD-dependent histone deacetylase [Cephalotrichum gorgonifer]|uniref:Related to NAD-dependent histone deacetylase n=1 Tax=Cephalotrichum gorgonifer TaxID=2041049 RepID=A0AAE8MV53_9PEZI|nr:related to NAD-dependent histone deacetylase [Cephalotrichum gorgonifer]
MGVEKSSPSTLEDRSLDAVASLIKNGRARRIVVLTGAGISTSAGIPDFRSPETGLYANLERLNLPHPEAVFDIAFFRENPEPFYVLAKELYPGNFHPTVSHAFISLLAKKNLLHKLFTQNIDCLERAAGVPSDKIIEAHGSFATQRCIECMDSFPDDLMKKHVEDGRVPKCLRCKGLVKPDIVFFGQGLPMEFSLNSFRLTEADLVLIIGTSLSVYPFAALPELCLPRTPRVLFNLEKVGNLGSRADDVLELGGCDNGIRKLAQKIGWLDELNDLWKATVGEEEVKKQLKRQGMLGEEFEEEEAGVIEAITAGLEGIELKGEGESPSSGDGKLGETAEVCEEHDKEALKGVEPEGLVTQAERKGGPSEALQHHLEAHLHQKAATLAVKSADGTDEAETQDAITQQGRTEDKASEGKNPDKKAPKNESQDENQDETSNGKEKL